MLNFLPMISKGAIAMMEIFTTLDAMEKLQDAPDDSDDKMIKTAVLVNKLIMLGFSMGEIGGLLKGVKSGFMHNLKSLELVPRLIQFPLSCISELQNLGENAALRDKLRFAERSVISPFADLIRVASESSAYYEQHFLEMSPEEVRTAQRPIMEPDGDDGFKIVGYRPVDLDECKSNLEACQRNTTAASLVRIGAELELGGRTFSVANSIYGRISSFFVQQGSHIPAIQRRINQARARNQAPDVREVFSLRALAFIPAPLHADRVFSQYICPITQAPIRHPAGDPNRRTIYERNAILLWLSQHSISPMTRLPLTSPQLLERPAVQALIDQRLVHHEQQLWGYLQQNPALLQQLNAAPPAELEQAANDEQQ